LQARSRTGVIDPQAKTYVEVGVFEKQSGRDTVAGTVTLNPVKDVQHLLLVNRRTFERPADVAASSDSGRLMDSLAETRTLLLRFNLRHPLETVYSGYNYIHVKELVADTTRLPLTDRARQGLDTIVHADSLLPLTLRPGGAALLRISYCEPGDTVGPGDTRFNNQKKLVFDGRRYHAVYWRPSPGAPHKDTIYYRRSLPVSNSTGAVRWDVWEYTVAPDSTGEPSDEDRFPSLTLRTSATDTVVTIVWSSASATVVKPRRHIHLRQITWNGNPPDVLKLRPIERVAIHDGSDPQQWGTPVVSSLHGGEMIAWSDSAVGVVARLRRLGSGSYGGLDTIVRGPGAWTWNGSGQYPSMPAFAHVAGRDSSIALVWQQPTYDPYSTGELEGSAIIYERLVDTVKASGDTILQYNRMQLSHNDARRHLHPSIDMTQDVWYGAQEGVAWESFAPGYDPLKGLEYSQTWVHFASIWTNTSARYNPELKGAWNPQWDSIGQAYRWTDNALLAANSPGYNTYRSVYPSTSSQNWRNDPEHQNEKITFGVSMSAVPNFRGVMQQAIVEYATSFLWNVPRTYLLGGYYPSTSSAPTRQGNRTAALYQITSNPAATLNTSRQFFAKGEKPAGYAAHGRGMHLRIDPSRGAEISARLHDVWAAGDGYSGPLRLVARPDSLRRTESLETVRHLFTSEPFPAHDSTTIGLELSGLYAGDTAAGAGMRVEYIAELVNTAHGQVVHRFDSFTVKPGSEPHGTVLAHKLDLLSGTYIVRLRVETENLTVAEVPYASRYPVEELTSYVEQEDGFGKVRRMEGSADGGRIAAWPNPASAMTEIRFSVPVTGNASVTLYDAGGREVRRPVEKIRMEEGRYSVMVDLSELPAGAYLLELRYDAGTGMRRVVEKLVISR
jgi:hypothetical protein